MAIIQKWCKKGTDKMRTHDLKLLWMMRLRIFIPLQSSHREHKNLSWGSWMDIVFWANVPIITSTQNGNGSVLLSPFPLPCRCFFRRQPNSRRHPASGSWRSQFLPETKKSFRAFERILCVFSYGSWLGMIPASICTQTWSYAHFCLSLRVLLIAHHWWIICI